MSQMWRTLAAIFLLCATASAQTLPTTAPIEIEGRTLDGMYRSELGEQYQPGMFEKLQAAHREIEAYFSGDSKRRGEIVKSLEATAIDPNVLGRITRIRLHWPNVASGIYFVNEQVGPNPVRYFLGVPRGYDRTSSWPLVIKLPTAHAFLTDPPPTPDDVANIYSEWIEEELTAHPDALVLMPLLNLDEFYGPSYAGMNTVIEPLRHVGERVNFDPARVYLIGHSMAAYAVWNLGLHYTTYFAAINPLAGAASGDWQRLRLMNLRNVLPVVWCDAQDKVLSPESSRSLVRALRGMKFDVEFEETNGVGHSPSPDLVARQYQKLRARTRALYPKQVSLQSNRPDTMFNRLDWVQVYQQIRTGPERRMLIKHGSGMIKVTQNACKIDAALTRANWIEAASENAASMRFYLNEQMIDFSQPVTVMVNRKVRFEGFVKPSVEEMLKDQIFLGRGWRYFTGVVDIDFGGEPATRAATPSTTVPAR